MGQHRARQAKVRTESPQLQLERFISKYSPEVAAEGRAALAKLRRLAPGAVELVYDNFNWLVVGFCPSERASDAVFSLVFTPRWLALCFLQNGPKLSDPNGLLRGSGKRVRNVRLESARELDNPAVRSLITGLLRARGFGLTIPVSGASSSGRSRPSNVLDVRREARSSTTEGRHSLRRTVVEGRLVARRPTCP